MTIAPVLTVDDLGPIVGREPVYCHVASDGVDGSGHRSFLAGHIPGARYVSVDDHLSATPGRGIGRHPLPSPEAFAATLEVLGIAEGAVVVAYDGSGGAFAARLVWMLRVIGQDAALLDGGMDAWIGELETGSSSSTRVERAPREWPADAVADADAVDAVLREGGAVIDSRARERYLGEVEPIDAVAGHIPGARNLPFADNLHDGRFRSPEDLRRRFAELGVGDVVVYCGSGVTACHNALAMESAGLPRPRLYVGSWSGWSSEGRPVDTGD